MLIIKPYGWSKTQDATKPTRRLKPPTSPLENVGKLTNKPEFIMRQWISVIDKIASKPKGNSKATAEQRKLRQTLGEAAWCFLQQDSARPLGDIQQGLWNSRIHPYPDNTPAKKDQTTQSAPSEPQTSKNKTPNPKGRWYADFVGNGADGKSLAPTQVDASKANEVIKRIHAHLNEAAQRKGIVKPKRTGHIAAQLQTITKNVLSPPPKPNQATIWQEEYWQTYFVQSDVAAEINKQYETEKKEAVSKAKADEKAKSYRVAGNLPGRLLYGHYAKVFKDQQGKPLQVSALLQQNAEGAYTHPLHRLFTLHCAIKACYKALLDSKKPKLPKDKDALKALLGYRDTNQQVASLVRLGKVIHYEAAGLDKTVREAWQEIAPKIAQSRYWLSDGQAEIKRNEALVRIWKLVISHAAHSLSDWANWHQGDILLAKFCPTCHGIKPAEHKNTERDKTEPPHQETCTDHTLIHSVQFDEKFRLLFGRELAVLPTSFTDAASRSHLLKFVIQAWKDLRNNSFHFKGRTKFLMALQEATQVMPDGVAGLWDTDQKAQQARLKATLRGAHCQQYLTAEQLKNVFAAVADATPRKLALPRLNRVLTVAQHVGNCACTSLPQAAKQKSLEKAKALTCQYTVLKLIYERAFPSWLEQQSQAKVEGWIKTACKRADTAAQKINNDKFAQARTNALQHVVAAHGVAAIAAFFEQLTAETAREFRVQRGYESDPEKAQKQAEFIENLKCEVVAQALQVYLQAAFKWLLDMNAKSLPQAAESQLEHLASPQAKAVDDWQKRLYFLLHLVPVGEVSSVLHQLRKWQVLEHKAGVQDDALYLACEQVLVLYLDMHDAKFDGGETLQVEPVFADCFENEAVFKEIYPTSDAPTPDDHRLPKRGLRELLRFGYWQNLQPIFAQHKVKDKDVKKLANLESSSDNTPSIVAAAQDKLAELHHQWVKTKNKTDWTPQNQDDYSEALEIVETHRHLAAQVRLSNHVRLHRLLMSVLARLVDYAGLWERDLYFVTLALVYQADMNIDDAAIWQDKDKGLEFLEDGQIVFALKEMSSGMKKKLRTYFSDGKNAIDPQTRNDLSHFNMLQTSAASLDLTYWVNQTRQLMAYDRKLKNAVAKSVLELLVREGLELQWKMNAHCLHKATIKSKTIVHLGGKVIAKQQGNKGEKVTEKQHGDPYCQMVAALFGGNVISDPVSCTPPVNSKQQGG